MAPEVKASKPKRKLYGLDVSDDVYELNAEEAAGERRKEAEKETRRTQSVLEQRFAALWEKVTEGAAMYRLQPEYRFDEEGGRKWRADFAHIQARVLIEVEGGLHGYGRHQRPEGFIEDAEKYNAAVLQGWALFRLPSDLIREDMLTRIAAFIRRRLFERAAGGERTIRPDAPGEVWTTFTPEVRNEGVVVRNTGEPIGFISAEDGRIVLNQPLEVVQPGVMIAGITEPEVRVRTAVNSVKVSVEGATKALQEFGRAMGIGAEEAARLMQSAVADGAAQEEADRRTYYEEQAQRYADEQMMRRNLEAIEKASKTANYVMGKISGLASRGYPTPVSRLEEAERIARKMRDDDAALQRKRDADAAKIRASKKRAKRETTTPGEG